MAGRKKRIIWEETVMLWAIKAKNFAEKKSGHRGGRAENQLMDAKLPRGAISLILVLVLGFISPSLSAFANINETLTEDISSNSQKLHSDESAADKTSPKNQNQDDSGEPVGVIVKIEENEVPTGLSFFRDTSKQSTPPALLNHILTAICVLLAVFLSATNLMDRKRKMTSERQQGSTNKSTPWRSSIAVIMLAVVSTLLTFNVDLNADMKFTNALTIGHAVICVISIIIAIKATLKIKPTEKTYKEVESE
jgi:uncharacterized membrane protein